MSFLFLQSRFSAIPVAILPQLRIPPLPDEFFLGVPPTILFGWRARLSFPRLQFLDITEIAGITKARRAGWMFQ